VGQALERRRRDGSTRSVNNAGVFAAKSARRLGHRLARWLGGHGADQPHRRAQLSRFAVRHWLERGTKAASSTSPAAPGHRGDSPDHWHYAASKGGMLALHKTIARAYAAQGILSFAIAPGFTDTAMAEDYLASRGGPRLLADIPLGRVASPRRSPRWQPSARSMRRRA
jgi:NAD(P)-dependent dehydrogenase (short-subunit alcohol dehydrogenase family)